LFQNVRLPFHIFNIKFNIKFRHKQSCWHLPGMILYILCIYIYIHETFRATKTLIHCTVYAQRAQRPGVERLSCQVVNKFIT
jgi:hypothetical protein